MYSYFYLFLFWKLMFRASFSNILEFATSACWAFKIFIYVFLTDAVEHKLSCNLNSAYHSWTLKCWAFEIQNDIPLISACQTISCYFWQYKNLHSIVVTLRGRVSTLHKAILIRIHSSLIFFYSPFLCQAWDSLNYLFPRI